MNQLHFDYQSGDVVILEDNRLAIIIHNGIYSNQYWCEICYPDGVHLAGADYFTSDIDGYYPRIVMKADNASKDEAIIALQKAVEDYEMWEDRVFADMKYALSPVPYRKRLS